MGTPNARGSIENKKSIGAADMMPVSSQVAYPRDQYAGMSPSAIRELLLVKPKQKPNDMQKPGVTNTISTLVPKRFSAQISGPNIEEIPFDQTSANGGLLFKTGSDKPFSGYVSWKGFGNNSKKYGKRYYQDGVAQSYQDYGPDDEPLGELVNLKPRQKGLR